MKSTLHIIVLLSATLCLCSTIQRIEAKRVVVVSKDPKILLDSETKWDAVHHLVRWAFEFRVKKLHLNGLELKVQEPPKYVQEAEVANRQVRLSNADLQDMKKLERAVSPLKLNKSWLRIVINKQLTVEKVLGLFKLFSKRDVGYLLHLDETVPFDKNSAIRIFEFDKR